MKCKHPLQVVSRSAPPKAPIGLSSFRSPAKRRTCMDHDLFPSKNSTTAAATARCGALVTMTAGYDVILTQGRVLQICFCFSRGSISLSLLKWVLFVCCQSQLFVLRFVRSVILCAACTAAFRSFNQSGSAGFTILCQLS